MPQRARVQLFLAIAASRPEHVVDIGLDPFFTLRKDAAFRVVSEQNRETWLGGSEARTLLLQIETPHARWRGMLSMTDYRLSRIGQPEVLPVLQVGEIILRCFGVVDVKLIENLGHA